ncbi:MAG: cation:dicarboxylase symporter family transporter, partial [Sedimentisphaerales bacterium]|nr:cation:dicarboxylase symporter family transporter [Sedimentisphaerales bacterium]
MKLKIHTQILIAIGVGIVLGVLLGPHAVHIKIIGDLFIRLLRMIIIPLIVASMITGVVSIGHAGKLGRMGLRTLLYYMATTLLAVLVGLILVNVIQPGAGVTVPAQDQAAAPTAEPPTFVSIITDIIPRNIIAAMSQDNVLAVIFFSLLFGVALTSVG